MRRRISIASILALLLLLITATPVFAIAAPDSGPFITRVDVYRHVLEDNDMLVVARYNVPYTSLPTETITQAYLGRFMDGSTELAVMSPYAYYRKGYDEGSYSMYLGAGGATWGSSYTVELDGSPTLEWTPSIPEVSTSTLNWRATTSTSATRALLYSHLIQWANSLGDYWSIALTTETSAGTKLSTYGDQYFTNVIPGLRTMCPNLFQAGLDVPAYEDTEWQMSQVAVLKGTWPLDWSGIGTWFGIESEEVFRTLIFLVIMMAVIIIVIRRSGKPELGVFLAFPAIIVAGATGWISVVFAVILTFACILAFGFVAVWLRSSA